MRDEGVIYVAGHPLLNRRCTRLPGCIRLRNDLYCVEWGVKLYSLTHSLTPAVWCQARLLFMAVASCGRFVKKWAIGTLASQTEIGSKNRGRLRPVHGLIPCWRWVQEGISPSSCGGPEVSPPRKKYDIVYEKIMQSSAFLSENGSQCRS